MPYIYKRKTDHNRILKMTIVAIICIGLIVFFIVFLVLKRKKEKELEKKTGDFFDYIFGSSKKKNSDLMKILNEKKDGLSEEAFNELKQMLSNSSNNLDQHDEKYFRYVVNLPFKRKKMENDLQCVQKFLDDNFLGLDNLKKSVVRFLHQKRFGLASTKNLLFYGCPGNGKTSFAKAIATALNRDFTIVSLGGINDESVIRGHSRTYIGSKPGRIIDAIRRCGSNNPVIVLDEIDKIHGYSLDGKGSDPENSLLEALDPEQNNKFRDHYVDLSFDLSNVLFIATANNINNVPNALKDRFQVLKVDNYSIDELNKIFDSIIGPKLIKQVQLKLNITISFETDFFKSKIEKCVPKRKYSYCLALTNRQINRTASDILADYLYNLTVSNNGTIDNSTSYVIKSSSYKKEIEELKCNI